MSIDDCQDEEPYIVSLVRKKNNLLFNPCKYSMQCADRDYGGDCTPGVYYECVRRIIFEQKERASGLEKKVR